jgi:2-keto-3-deoxy-6-phosphogluconate aldolase
MQPVVVFGEIMLRLKTRQFERFSQAREFEATYGGGEASISGWIKAGAAALAMGSNLVSAPLVKAGRFDALSERVGQVLAWIQKARA